jgi:PAS domain S-box-containing protein
MTETDVARANELNAAVNDIMLLINSSLNSKEIMQRVLKAAASAIGAESARIALRIEDHWLIRYVYKLPDELTNATLTDEELPHAALAMVTQKPVMIADAFNDFRCNPDFMKRYGIRSVVAVPLIEQNQVIGVLFLNYHSAPVSFSDVDLEYAEKIAAGTAVALQNARTYRELRELQKEIKESARLNQALVKIHRTIYSTLDSEEIFKKVLKQATEEIGAESCMVFSKETDGWVVRHVYKLSQHLIGNLFDDDQVRHTALTAETKEPMAVTDAYTDVRVNHEFSKMLQIRSLLDFPLIVKGEVIGDLAFHYHSRSTDFSEAQIEFVKKLQTSLSLALQNAHLFQALKKQTEAQKRVEAQLQETCALNEENVAELNAITNSMNDGLAILDMNGNIVEMNPAGLRMHGFNNVEEGRRHLSHYKDVFEITLLDGTPVALDDLPIMRARKGESFQNFELKVRSKQTDAYFIGSYSGAPVRDSAGKIIFALVTIRDITELKRREDELKRFVERCRTLVESTTDGFASFDRDWHLTYMNEKGANLLHIKPSEVRGKYLWEVCPSANEAIKAVAPGNPVHLEYYSEPLTIWIEAHCYATVEGPMVYFRDVTERKWAEERLQELNTELESRVAERTAEVREAYEKLQKETEDRLRAVEELHEKDKVLFRQGRLAAMGEMVGNIAHQWRQPLNSIALLAQELHFYSQQGLIQKEQVEASVGKIMDLIQHMSQTITDFRNFFKPEKEKRKYAINEVVESTLKLCEPSLKEAGVTVETMMSEKIEIEGFPTEFTQALLNIISNATDIFRERSVKAPRLHVTLDRVDQDAVIKISDNGGGISPEIIDRIFDPYFTSKPGDEGTGIGLYMSKQIIEGSMHGKISARNTDEGAEFTIDFCCIMTS